MPTQLLNKEEMDLMSAEFQRRYEPNFAWVNAGSALNDLPALRAFWPCGAQRVSTQAVYIQDTANNYQLNAINAPQFGYEGLIQYVNFNGTTQYAYYLDDPQFDILGTESYIETKGLTLGCWIYPDRATGNNEWILSKSGGGAAVSSYELARLNTGLLRFLIIDNALASVSVSSVTTIQQSVWQFVAGRFRPGVAVDNFLSTSIGTLVMATQATALNNINNGTAWFRMACENSPQYFFDGKISLAFICASALSDTMIKSIYHQTRALFGQ